MATTSLLLGVNIDHIATIRQQRLGSVPDPLMYAYLAQENGADAIVCHLRADRRHIQEEDVSRLRESVHYLNVELDFSLSVMPLIERFHPHRVTLVPEKRQELTTESGVDIVRYRDLAAEMLMASRPYTQLSFFIDPEGVQIDQALSLGVEMIELNTAEYARASHGQGDILVARQRLREAVYYAHRHGLRVVVGHGLDQDNIGSIRELYPMVEECNIGFSLVAQALHSGWAASVADMKRLLTIDVAKQRSDG